MERSEHHMGAVLEVQNWRSAHENGVLIEHECRFYAVEAQRTKPE
jgi:hypothetical protein